MNAGIHGLQCTVGRQPLVLCARRPFSIPDDLQEDDPPDTVTGQGRIASTDADPYGTLTRRRVIAKRNDRPSPARHGDALSRPADVRSLIRGGR